MELKRVCPDSCPGTKTKITIVYCISTNYGYLCRDDWTRTSGLHVPNVARHTFATMMLTLGADLYTVSKLLGHSDVKVTQVYAKIVNQKKNDAVNLATSVFS